MRAVPAGPLEAGIETEVAHALRNSLAQDGLALGVEVEVGREVGEALQDAACVHRLAMLLCNMARLKRIIPKYLRRSTEDNMKNLASSKLYFSTVLRIRIRDTGSGIRDPGYGIQDPVPF